MGAQRLGADARGLLGAGPLPKTSVTLHTAEPLQASRPPGASAGPSHFSRRQEGATPGTRCLGRWPCALPGPGVRTLPREASGLGGAGSGLPSPPAWTRPVSPAEHNPPSSETHRGVHLRDAVGIPRRPVGPHCPHEAQLNRFLSLRLADFKISKHKTQVEQVSPQAAST